MHFEFQNVKILKSFKMIKVHCMPTLINNFNINSSHIGSKNNLTADALSRGNFQKFRELAPNADKYPVEVPLQFWNLLEKK